MTPYENRIRLSGTSHAVLALLAYRGPSTPYDLKRLLEKSIENFWPVPHTTFYDEPARLAAAGLLTETRERGGRRRRTYEITEVGRSALREWADSGSAEPPQLRDELALKVFAGADPGPLLEQRMAWHEQKLAELEGYLPDVREAGGEPGVERSLLAGIAYHRALLGALAEATAASPGR